MKALILVAGNSQRMGRMTTESHKTLLPVRERPILFWMLSALEANGINDVIFVDGFHRAMLHRYVAEKHPGIRPIWVENERYAQTNTTASVLLAKQTVLADPGEGIVLINGDVVLDHRAIERTVHDQQGTVLATRFDRVDEEEVKVALAEDGRIREIGKHLDPTSADGESVGINRLAPEILPDLFRTMQKRVSEGDGSREFYEASFNQLIAEGADFRTADVTDLPVMEVDTPEDYEEVGTVVAPKLELKE